jgi:flagellar hook-associated protein 2
MRMTGLSGIDTESMIASLMKAEGLKLTRLQSQNQISLWTQSAYQNVASTFKSFQSSFLNLNSPTSGRLSSSYVKNTVGILTSTGQASNAIKAVGYAGAAVGKHTIKVNQLATAEKLTGTEKPGKVTSSFDSGEFIAALAEGDTITVNLDGLSKDIKFTAADAAITDEGAFIDMINKKLGAAFGTENDSGGTAVNKVLAQIDGGKVSFTSQKGHTATFTGADEVMIKLGIAKGASTNFNTSQTLKEAFGVPDDSMLSFTINDEIFSFSSTATISQMMSEVSNSGIGVKFYYDTLNMNFSLASELTGTANSIKIEDTAGFLGTTLGINATNAGASKAQDAMFEFDGVITTRDSNRITMAGITMDLVETTTDPLNITIDKDTSSGFDFVKNFVNAFNSMIDGLNAELRTSRPKKDSYNYYQPLTDEEKDAMKDSDVVAWEAQAKKGLLYNDSILSDIASQMRSTLYLPVKLDELENGRKISMFDVGISFTQNFAETGKLVIDEDKLKKALNEHGDDVAMLFTKAASGGSSNKPTQARLESEGLAERINDIINKATNSNGTISIKAGVAGDTLSELSSTMYKTIKLQNDRINEMLEYLQNKETTYYIMFSKMEQAITESNNQMAYLQAQLG